MWQHLKLPDVSLAARPRYSLVVDEDVKKPTNQTNKLTLNHQCKLPDSYHVFTKTCIFLTISLNSLGLSSHIRIQRQGPLPPIANAPKPAPVESNMDRIGHSSKVGNGFQNGGYTPPPGDSNGSASPQVNIEEAKLDPEVLDPPPVKLEDPSRPPLPLCSFIANKTKTAFCELDTFPLLMSVVDFLSNTSRG